MENVNNNSAGQTAMLDPSKPLPARLGPKQMMEIFEIPEGTFYRYQRQGKFTRFELPRAIGVKRYSGRLVEAYLSGGL
jgi:hypothetical protein